LAVAERNWRELKADPAGTSAVLLGDALSKDAETAGYGVFVLVGLGDQSTVPKLVDALNANGRIFMAEAFLNCGNATLRSEAQLWARRHGLQTTSGVSKGPLWGQF
jgi:hypothetical protein